MSEAAAKAFEKFQADVGNDEGTGEWFQVTQDQIDQFADVTLATGTYQFTINNVTAGALLS